MDLPPGKKAIGTKWVFKLKRTPDRTISRYKAPLVAKGYAQNKDIDYEETFFGKLLSAFSFTCKAPSSLV